MNEELPRPVNAAASVSDRLPVRVITDTFCDPVWQLRRRRKIHDLPDISTYEEGTK